MPTGAASSPLRSRSARNKFPVKYYLTAMLFIFDIEIVFLYPWAVAFDQRCWTRGNLVLFITLLVVYAYDLWRRRGLEWD